MSRRCWICHENIPTHRTAMIQHLKTCFGLEEPDGTWVCPLCGKKIGYLERLLSHLQTDSHDWKKFKVTRAMENM